MITAETGEGTALVLIHGFGVDSRIMQALEETVDFSGFRRIYVDLPWTNQGLNFSATSAQDVLNIVEAEIRHFLDDEPFALIGNSFGALIARCIAHNNPQVLGLATLAGVFEADRHRRNLPEKTVLYSDPGTLESAGDAKEDFAEISVIQNEENFHLFLKYVLPGLRQANQQILDTISQEYSIEPVPEEVALSPYDSPALHVFGRQDHVVGYKDGLRWLEHYRRGTFVVLERAGHNLHLEQPTLTGALIEEWLKRVNEYRYQEFHHDAPRYRE